MGKKYRLEELFPEMKYIYDQMMDDHSKKNFALRLLYNTTLDLNYLIDIIELIPEFDFLQIEKLRTLYNSCMNYKKEYPSRKFIIYGAGKWGQALHGIISNNFELDCFCDKDVKKQKQLLCGLPVISPELLVKEYKDDYVIIATRDYYTEVYYELLGMGVHPEQIISGNVPFEYISLDDKQYFDDSIMKPEKGEIFVDAGCLNFETSIRFKEWCFDDFEKIYAFEPDPISYTRCMEVIENSKIDKVELVNAGLWSKNDSLHFQSDGSGCSQISESGSNSIDVVSLDSVLEGSKVTFIKMDIEGSELEALKGAEKSIVSHRPKLAICIYHKSEDVLEIPLFLNSLIPDYKFYIRHYSTTPSEMVLYAI